MKILFLGASKRTSLLERFDISAKQLGIELKMFSCEKDDDFCAISHLAEIIAGPKFNDYEKFKMFLIDVIKKHGIDMIIPNMDSATVSLSKFCEEFSGVNAVVSSHELCKKMDNKKLADSFFREHDIPTFPNLEGFFPKIIKDIHGFGAKGQYICRDLAELNLYKSRLNMDNFIIQDFISGTETTADLYFNMAGKLEGYCLRDRLEVSGGEVMVCKTRYPDAIDEELIEKVSSIPGWRGCITLQYIRNDSSVYVVEINPRFGGGATCAIECGLDMPTFLMCEHMGIPYSVGKLKNVKMSRARRDFFYEYT